MNNLLLTQKSFTTSDAVVQYWTNGNVGKPAVFFMHGAAMDHKMFDSQYAALNESYYIIAWDARGHGQSRPVQGKIGLHDLAQDCLGILDDLHISQVILLGQSEGGMIAQEVYRLQPSRVMAMVTIGASPIMLSYAKSDIWLLKCSTSIIKLWPYAHFMNALALKTALKKDVQQYAMQTVKNISKKDFLSIWEGVTNVLSYEGIAGMHITVPLLITYGDTDTTGTVRKNNQRWKAYEPAAELAVIPNAGHNANQDNPQFFNELVTAFLGKIRP
ncbi:MAG TPA: alpha/beta hydrolase [Candidatus Saccharimonadales bacterium]|nr:alpha/beta hydrolase [Candidatus Saccharimonadales bacterium]